MSEEERRARYREVLEVKEIAGLLRGNDPAEIDAWVAGNIYGMDEIRWLLAAMLKYLAASGV